jgi:hypothetical protein
MSIERAGEKDQKKPKFNVKGDSVNPLISKEKYRVK